MLRGVLYFLNAVAIGLVLSASNLGPAGKGLMTAAVGLNFLCLGWQAPTQAKANRIGAVLSLLGYLGSAAAALVFVLKCGVAFVDRGCAAVMTPMFDVAWAFGILAVPVCYAGHFLVDRLRQPPPTG